MRRWPPEPRPEPHAENGADTLQRAQQQQADAARLGFDWPEPAPIWAKLREELAELEEAIAAQDPGAMRHELGDVLYTVVNLGRALGVPAQQALADTCARFDARLRHVQGQLDAAGQGWQELGLDELEACWQRAKREGGL